MKRFVSIVAALTLLLGVVREAKSGGNVWDAVADFNATGTNPLSGNPWAYGTESTVGGAFAPMLVFEQGSLANGSAAIYFFNQLGLQTFIAPAIGKNTGATTITYPAPIPLIWPNNVLLVGPGGIANPGSPEYSVVQFTAPATGVYSLSGSFLNLQEANTDLHILANTTSIYSNNYNGSESGFDPLTFSATDLNLSQGQTIQFIVGNNGAIEYDDVVGLSATISLGPSSVPEPSTLVLLGIGSIVLLGYAWRRRRLAAT